MKGRNSGAWRLSVAGALLAAPSWAVALPGADEGDLLPTDPGTVAVQDAENSESGEYRKLEVSFDTVVSAGVSMRMQDPDPSQIGIANGGTARTVNEDDGNLNYGKNDLISTVVKATHDLSVQYGEFGAFSRVNYFYDFETDNRDTCPTGSVPANNCLVPEAKDRLDWDFKLLDLFVYGRLNIGDHALKLRAGKQVINWGESTFIGNGINAVNPVDVRKLRTPGAEIKEALLPTPILSAGFDLTEAASVEALWLAGYDSTRIDPRGSFFSTSDTLSDGGDRVFTGIGRRNDQHQPFAPPTTPDPGGGAPIPNPTAQVWVPRADDLEPDHKLNQFGAALRYLSEYLNGTEFGLYYLRYHSRTPLFSVMRGTSTSLANEASGGGSARYFAEYPEDIDLFGLSYNTAGPLGIALQGEYSYRLNQPAQLPGTEVILAALGAANSITGDAATAAAVPVGTVIPGYRQVHMHQLQTTATKSFGPSFGADQFVLLGEAAVNFLDLPGALKFSGPGTALPAPGSANAAGGSFQTDGYATRFSWGYRAGARLDFENAIASAQLSPRLALAHDVTGVGPNFNHGVVAGTAGIGLNYLQRWGADLAYTAFLGGRYYEGTDTAAPPPGQAQSYSTSANPNRDRDFLSFSISYAF